jgi:hypothetical protein
MKKVMTVILILAAVTSMSFAQVSGKAVNEEEAVKKTALNYIEGYFSGDVERMEQALHPELTKVIPFTVPQTGKTGLSKMGASQLIEGTRAGMGKLEESERKIEVTVYDIFEDLATAKVVSSKFIDYLHLAKINGEWKIINVLWKMNPEAQKKPAMKSEKK